MKIGRLLIGCLLSLFAVSCSDDEEVRLDGKWQLQEIAQNGTVAHVDTVYYNFQNSLFMYQTYSPSADVYRKSYGLKAHTGDQLELELLSSPQPTTDFIPFTDWTSARRVFTVEKHDRKQLVLTSDGKSYTFRKF